MKEYNNLYDIDNVKGSQIIVAFIIVIIYFFLQCGIIAK